MCRQQVRDSLTWNGVLEVLFDSSRYSSAYENTVLTSLQNSGAFVYGLSGDGNQTNYLGVNDNLSHYSSLLIVCFLQFIPSSENHFVICSVV